MNETKESVDERFIKIRKDLITLLLDTNNKVKLNCIKLQLDCIIDIINKKT